MVGIVRGVYTMPKVDDDYMDYLGDGVYAYYDGYHIVLELTAQVPRDRIALEPPVFSNLIKYHSVIKELLREKANKSQHENGDGG